MTWMAVHWSREGKTYAKRLVEPPTSTGSLTTTSPTSAVIGQVWSTVMLPRSTEEIHASYPTTATRPSGLTDTARGVSGSEAVRSSRVIGSRRWTCSGAAEIATIRSIGRSYSTSRGTKPRRLSEPVATVMSASALALFVPSETVRCAEYEPSTSAVKL